MSSGLTFPRVLPGLVVLMLAGCGTLAERSVPDDPDPEAPPRFLRATSGASLVQPAGSGDWWNVLGQPGLDALMEGVAARNPDLAAAKARRDQAFAAVGITAAGLLPTIAGDASAVRRLDSVNNLLFPIENPQYEAYRLAASASWEIDLWGRVRASVSRDRFRAEAAQANYQDALLSLQASAARQYLSHRYLLRERDILRHAVDVRGQAVELQESRVREGAGIELDAARARTEFETAREESERLVRSIGKLEHSLAILSGLAPADFTLPAPGGAVRLPAIPSGLPSELLGRRPDVRSAERQLRAAAQEIGIRKVDFLPRIRLTGTGGVASLQTQTLFTSPDSFLYEIGPRIDFPIFEAGTLRSALDQARASWREAVANYQSAMLTAVREVEDSLLDLQVLRKQIAAQSAAAAAARKTVELSVLRYDRGLVSFLEVVDAERARLQAERIENALFSEQVTTTVQLIQALGGGW